MTTACSIRVRGVVQGVGFRPFVYRLAQANMLTGWVLNGNQGVEIHLEGVEEDLATFVREIRKRPPAAAYIADIEVESTSCEGFNDFTIRESESRDQPIVRVSPDLPRKAIPSPPSSMPPPPVQMDPALRLDRR